MPICLLTGSLPPPCRELTVFHDLLGQDAQRFVRDVLKFSSMYDTPFDEARAQRLFLAGRFRDLELYLFQRLDADGNSLVTWEEAKYCRLFEPSSVMGWLRWSGWMGGGEASLFLQADEDADGVLARREFLQLTKAVLDNYLSE